MHEYDDPEVEPNAFSAYGHAWGQLWNNFFMLLGIGFVWVVIQSFGTTSATWGEWEDGFGPVEALGFLWYLQRSIFATLFTLFVVNAVKYGYDYVNLKAARDEDLQFGDLFASFKNYFNSIVACFLVGTFTAIGTIFLVIPGIIIGCKLAFTPYLVVDRNMNAMDAMAESWSMTKGYGWEVFFIWVLGIPVCIVGLLCLGIGLIPALMVIQLAYASLYHAVDSADYVPYPDEEPLFD